VAEPANGSAARVDLAIFALIIDANDDATITFYQHHGFRRFVSKPGLMFLPIAAALQALNAKSNK
jgi:hypothetical protein